MDLGGLIYTLDLCGSFFDSHKYIEETNLMKKRKRKQKNEMFQTW